jgi:Flp pilus assembly protein TadD
MGEARVEGREARSGAALSKADPEVTALFDQGRSCLDNGNPSEALECLRQARTAAPEHAQIRSYLGLAVARSGGDFSEARSLCEDATTQEFFNPDLYLNLAKVFLSFGRRPEALRYLRRGLMIAPGHEGIRASIQSLGNRRLPVVPFLPRRHPVNRVLGNARSRMMSALRA